jgi:hypothetical protein
LYQKNLQGKTLSCEASATSDILASLLKRKVGEDEIIDKLANDWFNKSSQKIDDIRIWGNPNKGFV